ncbi:MAG: hypothetical protein V4668_03790 [Patescibacteria group bacterium]
MNLNQKVSKVGILPVVILGLIIQALYFTTWGILSYGFGGYPCISVGGPNLPNNCSFIDWTLTMALLQNVVFLYPTLFSLAFAYLILAFFKTLREKSEH